MVRRESGCGGAALRDMKILAPDTARLLAKLKAYLTHTQSSVLLVCLYSSRTDIEAVEKQLERPIMPLEIDPENLSFIRAWTALPSEPRLSVSVRYFAGPRFLGDMAGYANYQRDLLERQNHAMLFWLPSEFFERFVELAPNFWAWHSGGLFDFAGYAPTVQPSKVQFDFPVLEHDQPNTQEPHTLEPEWNVERLERLYALERETLQEELAKDEPDAAYVAELYFRLANLSGQLGERKRALVENQVSVKRFRELAKFNSKNSSANLASALNNHSIFLEQVGLHEAALEAIQEAVLLQRALVQDNPQAFTPDLAASLNNLSNSLGTLGQREAALEAIQEAVLLRRALVQDNPQAFTPDLTGSLNNLSNRLDTLGQREAALEAIQEAVLLRRALVQDNPQAFTPDLAGNLNNLSNRLSSIGQREAAFEAIQESIALYEPLAREYPQAFEESLATARADLEYIQSTLEPKPAP